MLKTPKNMDKLPGKAPEGYDSGESICHQYSHQRGELRYLNASCLPGVGTTRFTERVIRRGPAGL